MYRYKITVVKRDFVPQAMYPHGTQDRYEDIVIFEQQVNDIDINAVAVAVNKALEKQDEK